MAAIGSVKQTNQINNYGPLPVQEWIGTVTVPAAATSVTVTTPRGMAGTITECYIDPTTLTVGANIKVYWTEDGLTTPLYAVNYTVPNPAVEVHDACILRVRGRGTLTCAVTSATAADSFVLYVLVDPNADTSLPVTVASIPSHAVTNAGTFAVQAAVALDPNNLVPNSTQADQALTVDATVGGVQFSAFHADTTHVEFDVQTAQVRYTLDNSAPTATNGHILEAGDYVIWPKARASAAKFIQTGGTSAVLHASQLKGA